MDLTRDNAYYRVLVDVPPGEPEDAIFPRLVPGMPVKVFMRTAERTPMSYFMNR